MTNETDTIAEIGEWNAFHLSGNDLADTYSPDRLDSPGAQFLLRVRDDVLEDVAEIIADADDWLDVRPHEIADSAVPIYTADLWGAFTDLGAYNEDVREFGDPSTDMTQNARVCLYIIADRLARAVAQCVIDADKGDL